MTSSSLRAGQIVAMALLGFSAPPVAATGTTIRVPADKPTIQAAIDAASNGDTVFVSDGTYKENINFEGKAVTLTSVNGAATTIIDGGGSDCGVKFVTNEGLDSVLAGFTIRNGFGSFFCGFNAGGVWIFNSSPTITNNTIIGNTSCGGAGIGIKFGSPLVQGNVITQNNATLTTCPNGGGGISIVGSSSAQILGNTISNNIVTQGTTGGGIGLFGAGTPTIRGNTITGNSIDTSGGGIG